MQGYDLLMIVVLVAAVVWGAWKGFAWQVASIASMVASYMVALTFRQQVAQFIDASPPWNIFVSMLILFLGTSLVVWIGFNLVAEMIEKVKLKEFDRQVGAMFGFAKGVLLCVLITLFAVTLLSEPQRQAICNSRSGYYIAVLLDRADAVIPGEVHEVLDPYIDRLDRAVDHPHTEGEQRLPEPSWSHKDEIQEFNGPEFTAMRDEVIEAQPARTWADLQNTGTTARVPDGGKALLGGVKRLREGRRLLGDGATGESPDEDQKLGIELEP